MLSNGLPTNISHRRERGWHLSLPLSRRQDFLPDLNGVHHGGWIGVGKVSLPTVVLLDVLLIKFSVGILPVGVARDGYELICGLTRFLVGPVEVHVVLVLPPLGQQLLLSPLGPGHLLPPSPFPFTLALAAFETDLALPAEKETGGVFGETGYPTEESKKNGPGSRESGPDEAPVPKAETPLHLWDIGRRETLDHGFACSGQRNFLQKINYH